MAVNYTYLASCYCTTSVPGFYQYRPILPAGSCETVTTKLELASRFIQGNEREPSTHHSDVNVNFAKYIIELVF